jgi:hypothetical protein
VAPATLASVPAADSGSNGDWVGVLARENVLVFNKSMIKEEQLPSSLVELAKPEWKGKLAIAPTDADFLPLVAAPVTTVTLSVKSRSIGSSRVTSNRYEGRVPAPADALISISGASG